MLTKVKEAVLSAGAVLGIVVGFFSFIVMGASAAMPDHNALTLPSMVVVAVSVVAFRVCTWLLDREPGSYVISTKAKKAALTISVYLCLTVGMIVLIIAMGAIVVGNMELVLLLVAIAVVCGIGFFVSLRFLERLPGV